MDHLSYTRLRLGRDGESSSPARRPDEPDVNILIDGNTVNSNLAYSANTGYISVSSGSRHLQVEAINSSTPIVDTTLTLADSTNTTVIVTGTTTISPIVLTDDTTTPTSGTAEIRLVNAAPSMGGADVYVFRPVPVSSACPRWSLA